MMKYDQIVEKFTKILQKNLDDNFQETDGTIFSYRFTLGGLDFNQIAKSVLSNYQLVFFFDKPAENKRFIAVGSVLRIQSGGNERFEALENSTTKNNPVVVHHLNGTIDDSIPLFVGSMSFSDIHNDRIWDEFSPSDWFIPEFIIVSRDDNLYISYQVRKEQKVDNSDTVSRLTQFLLGVKQNTEQNVRSVDTLKIERNNEADNNWKKRVAEVIREIKNDKVKKVVLSRRVKITSVSKDRIIDTLLQSKSRSPNSYIFLYKSNGSVFFGLSPEKLASFSNNKVFCHAIAGSTKRGKTEEEDAALGEELLNSGKNRYEHQVVIDHISMVLQKHCKNVQIDKTPHLQKMSYIQHLFTGTSGTPVDETNMFRILKDLHPTPAVGGYPLEPALKIIQDCEQYDRGLYTGFIGWFDAQGNGDFCVTLRSGLFKDDTLYAFVGGGIVRDSIPEDEFEETEVKLQAITTLLNS